MRIREFASGRTDRQTECINAFQNFVGKIYNIKKEKPYNSTYDTLPIVSRNRNTVHEKLKLMIPFL